jgi:hypothetical protein
MSKLKRALFLCLGLTLITGSAAAGQWFSCTNGDTCKALAQCNGDFASVDGCKVQCYVSLGTFGYVYVSGSASCGQSDGGVGSGPKVRTP